MCKYLYIYHVCISVTVCDVKSEKTDKFYLENNVSIECREKLEHISNLRV